MANNPGVHHCPLCCPPPHLFIFIRWLMMEKADERETLVCIDKIAMRHKRGERRWFVLERPRRDTNGGSETEVTVTSKLPANAERNKEIEKIQEREEKAASFGGAVRGSVPEDELSGEGVRHSEAESEGGRRPECPG